MELRGHRRTELIHLNKVALLWSFPALCKFTSFFSKRLLITQKNKIRAIFSPLAMIKYHLLPPLL